MASNRELAAFFGDIDPFHSIMPFAVGPSRTGTLSGGQLARGMPQRDMPLDVQETDKSIEIAADVPGVKKDAINLSSDKDVLNLSVNESDEKSGEQKRGGVKWHHTERSRAFTRRSLRMPETADLDNVSARYTDGTLHISVPKKEQPPQSKRIAIN